MARHAKAQVEGMKTGAYSICYKEADWLGFNIRRMYDWLDAFSIAVGPVEKLMGSENDFETAEKLRAIPDPDHKITVTGGVWKDKNEMARAALAKLNAKRIIQLDSDEVWPKWALEEALVDIAKMGQRTVRFHMYTFWKDTKHITQTPDVLEWVATKTSVPHKLLRRLLRGETAAMEALHREITLAARLHGVSHYAMPPDKKAEYVGRLMSDVKGLCEEMFAGGTMVWTPWLLDMARAFAPHSVAEILHIPPCLAWPNGEVAYPNMAVTAATPLWHFSYLGEERVARKFDFFNRRNGTQVMPPAEYFHDWNSKENLTDVMSMTGQMRGFAEYKGPELPDDVREFAEGMK